MLGQLWILDATEPATLSTIGTYWHGAASAREVRTVGNYLYLRLDWLPSAEVDRGQRVNVVDVTDPARPRPLGFVAEPAFVTALAVNGATGYAVTEDGETRFHVLDLADPARPRPAGSVILGGARRGGHAIAVDGRHAYAIGTESAPPDGGNVAVLQVIDVGDARQPRVVGRLETPGGFSTAGSPSISASGGLVVFPVVAGELLVVDARQPRSPALAATIVLGEERDAVAVLAWADTAAVAGYPGGVHLFDLRDPAAPRQLSVIGTDPAGDRPLGLAHEGHVLYVSGRGGVSTYDVSDPGSPALVGRFTGPAYVPDSEITFDSMAVDGDLLYARYGTTRVASPGVAVLRVGARR